MKVMLACLVWIKFGKSVLSTGSVGILLLVSHLFTAVHSQHKERELSAGETQTHSCSSSLLSVYDSPLSPADRVVREGKGENLLVKSEETPAFQSLCVVFLFVPGSSLGPSPSRIRYTEIPPTTSKPSIIFTSLS